MIKTSEQCNEIYNALASAQGEFPPIPKNKTVEVKSREGKFLYAFDYADLTQIIESTRPSLKKNGLGFSQSLIKDDFLGIGYVTRIIHSSGQWMEAGFIPTNIDSKQGMKEVAANVTYGKRLSLTEALGISADDDLDAPNENGEELKVKPKGSKRSSNGQVADYKISFGKHKGKSISDLTAKDLAGYVQYIKDESKKDNKEIKGVVKEFIDHAEAYLASCEVPEDTPKE